MGTVTSLVPRESPTRGTARGPRGRIAVQVEAEDGTVRIRVAGGRMPVRIFLYVDGDLADMWVDLAAAYDLTAGRFSPGPHAITARAVDNLGRWGGASMVVETTEAAV